MNKSLRLDHDDTSGRRHQLRLEGLAEDGKGDVDSGVTLSVPPDNQQECSWDFDVLSVVYALRPALISPNSPPPQQACI